MLLLYGTLLLSALIVALLVYRYDLYDKEPWYMVLLTLGLGAAVMSVMTPLEMMTFNQLEAWFGDRWRFSSQLAFVAATHEELGKFVIVLIIAGFFRGVFNDPMDGLIYGSLAGLGAAVEESIGMIADHAGPIPPAEIVRHVGHAIMGGIGGFGVGLFVIRHPRRHLIMASCLLAAMALHYLWDVIALEQIRPGSRHSLLGAALMLIGLMLYGRLVLVAERFARSHFRAEHHHRLFGWPLSKAVRG